MPNKKEIVDLDVRSLAISASALRAEYVKESSEWKDSPFAWIKNCPSRQVGTIGERLVADWLTTQGFVVSSSGDSEADRIVNGMRMEIKFSTLWKNGHYVFQQIRNQRYELIIWLGVSPFDAHAWVISKSFLFDNKESLAGLKPQHGGRAGRDTLWIQVRPDVPYDWLHDKGGSLKEAVSSLRREITIQEK